MVQSSVTTIILSRLYADDATAQAAIRDLRAAGAAESDIGIIASTLRNRPCNGGPGDGTDPGTDAGVGTVAGGSAGLLAASGLLALPGIGPVVAAGWLAAAITAALTGGAADGVHGALIAAGIGSAAVSDFLDGVRRGGALVTIRIAANDRARFDAILGRAGSAA